MSFFRYYFGIDDGGREVAVCCPFPHTTPGSQLEYYEQHPSAHVNLEERVFHCKVCGQGHSEQSFVSAVLGCTYGNALRLIQIFNNDEDILEWDRELLKDETLQRIYALGITPEVIRDLHLKTGDNDEIAFPVFMYDKLVDIRKYNPGQSPKIKSRSGAINGLVLPYDLWRLDKRRVTLICAGEKDMAVARSHNFNAITLTGGENTLPTFPEEFKDRNVVILYDNDAPGKAGAIKLANYLKPVCKSVKNCTAFHEVCREDKEDLTDFFNKYGGTREQLIQYMEQTPIYEYTEIAGEKRYPVINLHTASYPQYVGKMVRSNIQVVAVSEATFVAPATLVGIKFKESDNKDDRMRAGEIREWILNEDTVQDVLHLIDNNFTEKQLGSNYRRVLNILDKEKNVRIKRPHKETIFKAYVTDMFETSTDEVVPMEYTVYSIGHKLESGKKYLATYKLVPHPYHGQQLTMLITKVYEANDSVSNFVVGPREKELLNTFRNLEGTVGERITQIVERFKDILKYDGNNTLITSLDLAYHTVLEFHFGAMKNVRGYLDTLVVGESRMGKSSTAEALRKTYGLGAFVSLAGNAATVPGLIGGSNKTNGGSYQTRAGIIPQNHRGLIIFEELGKSNANVLAELTDIRSSNEVRITRVSGTLTLPATVRMLALSNVKSSDGVIKSIASYPHGIGVLTELVGTAEDIARYDLICILSDRGAREIDPYWQPLESFSVDAYRTRVRWVWSRTADHVIISDTVGRYIVEQANQLNRVYDCHIKIFGTEAWKKIARLAIAVAGYLVSTDDEYHNIIVTSEHVQFAVEFLKSLYDNATFKLKEYVEHERMYSEIDDDGVALLQELYIKCPAMLLHLEVTNTTSKNALQAATGLSNDEYNAIMNRMISGMFIVFSKYDILPTERFRLGMARINRNVRVPRVGERT